MSSLDEVYEQMRLFQQALRQFDEEVRLSASALAQSHEAVCGLWQDEAAVRYGHAYEPLAQSLDQYLRQDAPRFERFVEDKVARLEQYLRGA